MKNVYFISATGRIKITQSNDLSKSEVMELTSSDCIETVHSGVRAYRFCREELRKKMEAGLPKSEKFIATVDKDIHVISYQFIEEIE